MAPEISLNPAYMDGLLKIGDWIARSGMYGVTKPEQGAIIAMSCLSKNLSITEFFERYHIIENRPSMRADAMLADFQQRGGTWEWLVTSPTEACLRLNFNGSTMESRYTIADAARAGLCAPGGGMKPGQKYPGNWQHRPQNMLRARAISEGIRMICPMVNAGVYTPEEMVDATLDTITLESVSSQPRLDAPPPHRDAQETIAFLEKNSTVAVPFLRHINFLHDGQTLADIAPGRLEAIAKNRDRFFEKAHAFVQNGGQS